MGRRWTKSDRRTAETLKKMEDHLRQTEGLMRPIGCSLGLTELKERLLVASQSGPLSPR